jgi:hypothetical protein
MARVASWNEADLDALFSDPSGPAQTVAYSQNGGSPANIQGIYDNPGDDFEGPGHGKMIRQKPKIKVKAKDVVGISNKDTFVIAAITYNVTQFHDDGWGCKVVDLSLQAT